MMRFFVFALWAATALAQTPADLFNKPPADVDQALRARINEFYQDHVTGEFRKAEALVAEDTKEFFYDHDKPKYLSFSISHIQYSDDFTRAKATILCEQYVMFPGFAGKPVKIPTPSTWKLVDGKWYWYVDQKTLRETPFGTRPENAANAGSASGPAPVIPDPSELLNQVRTQVVASPESVSLKPGESGEITISNHSSGTMTLAVDGKLAGVTASLDQADVKAGGKAVLTLRAGEDAKPGKLNILVVQLNQSLPIQINIE
ncbi:MAG TPA: hypothetical protein VG675_17140 [Bryobacteraceae bacterium]|nr:hypothetical protein [Bryobacteraceae bacterium]